MMDAGPETDGPSGCLLPGNFHALVQICWWLRGMLPLRRFVAPKARCRTAKRADASGGTAPEAFLFVHSIEIEPQMLGPFRISKPGHIR
jgi:hypothetical protein